MLQKCNTVLYVCFQMNIKCFFFHCSYFFLFVAVATRRSRYCSIMYRETSLEWCHWNCVWVCSFIVLLLFLLHHNFFFSSGIEYGGGGGNFTDSCYGKLTAQNYFVWQIFTINLLWFESFYRIFFFICRQINNNEKNDDELK